MDIVKAAGAEPLFGAGDVQQKSASAGKNDARVGNTLHGLMEPTGAIAAGMHCSTAHRAICPQGNAPD
jgi:hypothetical protein